MAGGNRTVAARDLLQTQVDCEQVCCNDVNSSQRIVANYVAP